MDEQGCWRLFEATGLPEAYLAVCGAKGGEDPLREEPAQLAFQPGESGTRLI